MDKLNRWQDRVEMITGIWLCAAPWILDLPMAASWCAVVGAFVILLSGEEFRLPDTLEEWGNAVLGVGLVISPWVWGYADHRIATVNAVVCGILVTGFAIWALERLFMHDRVRHS